jgi:hypothetical protein
MPGQKSWRPSKLLVQRLRDQLMLPLGEAENFLPSWGGDVVPTLTRQTINVMGMTRGGS